MRTIARQKVVELSWRLQESKKRFQWAIPPIPRNPKQLSVSISGYSANQKTDSVSLPRTFHEAENNSLSQSSDTPWIKKLIPFRYLGHSTKPKTTFCLNLRTLHELNYRSHFVSSDIPRSRKQLSVSISGHSTKPKTNLNFDPQALFKAKNESRF